MNTELTVLNSQQEQAIMAGGLGLDGFSSLRPTPMTLVQPTTDVEGVPPGKFLDRLTGMTFDQIEVVLLSIQEFREKYPSEKFVRGERPTCRSRDGIMPIMDDPNLIVVNPEGCKTCPAASWKGYDFRTKTGPKPTCRDKRRLIFIESSSSLPFFMTSGGTTVKTIRLLKESIVRNAIMQNKKFEMAGNKRRMNLFDYKVVLGSQKAKDGPYYDLIVKAVNPMAESEAAQFGPMYMELIARKHEIEAEIEAEQTKAAVEGEIIESESI